MLLQVGVRQRLGRLGQRVVRGHGIHKSDLTQHRVPQVGFQAWLQHHAQRQIGLA